MNVHLVLASYANTISNSSVVVFSTPYPMHMSSPSATQTVLWALSFLS